MPLTPASNRIELISALALCACAAIALFAPLLGDPVFRKVESLGSRLVLRSSLAVGLAGIAPIILRVSLLKWFGAPVPGVHDEFSYLVAADTFAHGRLTNPSHPMWVYFETFHVNMLPSYMSKYPPGQGAALAIGQLLGHPWIGVLLSVGAMCAAIVWMLQGWFSARWALLGGVLVAIQFCAFNYWMDSYWGGAVAAIGGALVAGAIPRIVRRQRPRDALIFGTGAAILANTRPWEGSVFCATACFAIAVWILTKNPAHRGTIVRRVVAPAALVLIATSGFVAYDNWRVTGSALLFPYRLNDRTYLSTPHFVWQKLSAPLEYRNAQFDSFYNDLERTIWADCHFDKNWRVFERCSLSKLDELRQFFLPYEVCAVVLVTLPWLWRDFKVRVLALLVAACLVSVLAVVWFEPHYAAPMTAPLFGIIVQAMRYLRKWRWRGRPIGIGLTRVVVAFSLAMIPVRAWTAWHRPPDSNEMHMKYRAEYAAKLGKTPGRHLVIVRYSPDHDAGEEWVYNRAGIDGAKVVWAREIPEIDMRPLFEYFRDRKIWLLEADADPPKLSPW